MKDIKRIPVGDITLRIVAAAGVIALVAVAPGLGLVLKQFQVASKLNRRGYVANTLSRLKRKGYINFEGTGKARRVGITEAGRRYLNNKRIALLDRPRTRRWDGEWRIVIFDIPEKFKKLRDTLRTELASVGFKRLQGSVWISPDECEDYVKLLKADHRIGKHVIYLKTRDIEYDSSLRKLFTIKRT